MALVKFNRENFQKRLWLFNILTNYVYGKCNCDLETFYENVDGGMVAVGEYVNEILKDKDIKTLTADEREKKYIAPYVNQYI